MGQPQLVSNTVELPIYSVKDLSLHLKRTVEGQFAHVRVRGEVSSLKRHTSGHVYFTLKDEDAVINGVCWRGMASKSPVQLEDGLEIIASGRLSVYEKRSNYQIIVESFEPTGQGALLKLLEDREKMLAGEGLFDPERKKQLPKMPQVIGVVTSPTGAVIRDILHRISDRFPCRILVWPVAVQGDGAAEQVAEAIRGFNALAKSPKAEVKPDTLIVARGGGSLEDLWAFNEEIVARAAAESEVPLISAVGHETDTTLIDYVSDKRAPTPTAAAEMAVPVMSDLWLWLQNRTQRVTDITYKLLERNTLQLQGLSRGLPTPQRLIEDKALRLDEWAERLLTGIRLATTQPKQKLDLLAPRFYRVASQNVETLGQGLEVIKTRLEHASYQSTLQRGFALTTTNDGKPIQTSKEAAEQSLIQLHYQDGVLEASPGKAEDRKAFVKTKSSAAPVIDLGAKAKPKPAKKTAARKKSKAQPGQGSLF